VKWQQHRELASPTHFAADFDAAVMIFHDPARKRESEAGAFTLGGVERPEDVWQVLRRDAAPRVTDDHAGVAISRADLDHHGACSLHRLDCIQQEV
jgi:hypothetical protein